MRIKFALLTGVLLFAASVTGALAAAIQLPNGPGVNVVYSKCQTCHDLQYVTDAKGLLPNQWRSVLTSMKDYGLKISNEEQEQLLGYLIAYLGPNPPPPMASASEQKSAIDGCVRQWNCRGLDGLKLYLGKSRVSRGDHGR